MDLRLHNKSWVGTLTDLLYYAMFLNKITIEILCFLYIEFSFSCKARPKKLGVGLWESFLGPEQNFAVGFNIAKEADYAVFLKRATRASKGNPCRLSSRATLADSSVHS